MKKLKIQYDQKILTEANHFILVKFENVSLYSETKLGANDNKEKTTF